MKKVEITEFKTKKINSLTGGKIASHKIDNHPVEEGVLINSFLAEDGSYIGDYGQGWWYVKHQMKVCNDYPHGVAERWNEDYSEMIGYHGYTHRGGQTFKIGDRLFDENYKPVKEDYNEEQWKEWEDYFNKKREEGDDFDRNSIYDEISSVIPFKLRGSKVIKSMDEAKQAAINMSKYLS